MRQTFAAAAPIFAMIALATPATAGTVLISNVLTFASSGPPNAVDFIDNGNGTTSLVFNVSVTITAIAGPLAGIVPTTGTFILSGISTNSAATAVIGSVDYYYQRFSGRYEVEDAQCGIDSICLGGNFVGQMSGPVGRLALTLLSSDPPVNGLTMFSDPGGIPASLLGPPLSMTLIKTGLIPVGSCG
jgi:hypothetical protein